MKNIQTLHAHTTTSDGLLSHLELLECANKNNIAVIAFTDHDSLPNKETIELLKKRKRVLPNWIVGIEISVDSGAHMIGLFVDPFNKQLLEHCKNAQRGRRERMRKIVNNLRGLGFDISEEECLKASGGEAVGRPHIVKALWEKPSNLLIVEKIRKNMKEASITDETIRKKYDNMMQRGESQYPYVLFLSDDSFIKGIDVEYGYRIDFDTSVKLIHGAGGLAILAHYSTTKKKISWESLEKIIAEKRLDGIETVYAMTLFGTKEGEEWMSDCVELEKLVRKYGIVRSGGADAHTEQHIKDFSLADEYNSKTVGMAEEMIKKTGIDTTWSSF